MPLTKLALYILSLDLKTRREKRDKLERIIEARVSNILKRSPVKFGRVCAVLDCSYSSSGSLEKRRRPLGIALAINYLLMQLAREYRAFWTLPTSVFFW